QSDDGLQIHQPIGASARAEVAGSDVDVDVESELPGAGRISVSIRALPAARFDLAIRAPAWAGNLAMTVDGRTEPARVGEDGYLRLNRVWRDSTVELAFDVRTRLTAAHPAVRENRGRMVVEHGPFVHCLQGTDNTGVNVHEARLATADPERAGEVAGAPTLALATSHGRRAVSIPYFAWANEGPTDMAVWIAS
ncbi:MAG: glycoside hydrolase family 127 protein, partial [Candidatus Methanoperedens sp.]|nr:glycoside hydrolase family 127 protein [Candidatus Methanoperedens sp.]